MEPFSLECTTCQARLKVRDESAIGQILTCPKCSSMVLVERPVDFVAGTHADPDAVESAGPANSEGVVAAPPAATGNPLDQNDLIQPPPEPFVAPRDQTPQDQTLQDQTPGDPRGPADGVPTTSPAIPTEPLGPLSDTVEDLSVYGTQQPPLHKIPPPAFPLPKFPASLMDEQPLLPTDAWSSESSQRVRNWLMLGGAATIGIFVAVGVFALVAMRLARHDVVVVGPAGQNPATSSPDQAGDHTGGADAGVANPSDADHPPASEGSAAAAPANVDAGEPSLGKPDTGIPAAIVPDAGAPAAMPPTRGGTLADDPPLPDDDHPPGFVGPAVSEEFPPGFVAREDTTASSDESLDKTLRGFEELLDPAPSRDASPASAAAMADLEIEDSGPKRPAPRAVDVAARLADTFEEVQFDGTPLNDFLRFVASFSTIPITLDPDALLWLGVTPETPVSAHQKTATVQLLVQGVVESVGLTSQVVGDQLLVTLPEEGIHRELYAIGDLANSAEQRQVLATRVTGLVAPDTWQAAGGLGSIAVSDEGLTIQQSTPVQQGVLRFLEKLRVARGLSPTSSVPAANFDLASRFTRARKQLEKSITLNFFQPTQLDQVADRLAKSADVVILIDWQALLQAGWNSDTLVTLTVNDTPLAKALDELLEPRGLGYRCVDTGLLQITSAERLKSTHEFEIYPLGKLLAPDSTATEIIARLREAMGAEWFSDGGGTGLLVFDAPGNALLASLPQAGQIRLEKALAELPAETPE